MTLLLDAIRGHVPSFDDTVYPTDIYYYLLKRVRETKSPDELGSALAHLLAWKDGKVRRDHTGPHVAYPNRSYRVERTKPNTLNARHEGVLRSEAFFTWALVIRDAEHFDATLIETLQEQFPLWTSIVLPVFVLHCLRPAIYPIVDRYVIAVFNILRPPYAAQFRPTRITVDAYEAYHQWWLQLMREAGIQPLSAELNELKEIDSGIWALGKSISKQAKELGASTEDDPELPAGKRREAGGSGTALATRGAERLGTDSKEFKTRAIALWQGGRTQADAVKVAAEEMGITLKRSYSAYPGSHFDRWRKQGFWSKE
jgi:hypothetical protein